MERRGQLDFSGGANTKDHPRDMASNECQELVNAYPGHEPRPREGCPRWNTNLWRGDVYELIDWKDAKGDKVIAWTSHGFEWAKRGASASTVIKMIYSSSDLDSPKNGSSLCWQRVENSLIIGSDDRNGWGKIIEWDPIGQTFVGRNANIKTPPGMRLSIAPSSEPGKLTPERWYSYTFTLVNHDSLDGIDHTKAFTPGKLESPEDIAKRIAFYLPAGFTSAAITVYTETWLGVDQQANHVRIYRTQPQLSKEEAEGFSHGWLVDLPGIVLGGSVPRIDKEAGTEVDAAPSTTGLDGLPPCRSMIYMNGRLWVNGAFGGSPGRWWYSSGIQNAVSYLKHLTMFQLDTDFKDCSLDDAQEATGAAIAGGDLYFFNSRSVFRLDNGDVAAVPQVISTNIGCPFPRTITPVNTWIYFLSHTGPRMIQGGDIDPVRSFKRGEIWPNSREGGSILRYGRDHGSHSVVGFWYRDVWWIAAGDRVVGFYSDEASGIKGGMRIQFADPGMSLRRVAILSEEEAVFAGSDRRMLWFLRTDNHTDCGYWITVTVKTGRLYVDVKDPSKR